MAQKKVKEQKKVFQVSYEAWDGKRDLVAVYRPEDNLGVAGIRLGSFYADVDPDNDYAVYANLFGFAKVRFWPKHLSLLVETCSNYLRVGLIPLHFRVR